jgi:acetyltransferase-like isoleucine patch superfamily enzyme
VKKLKTIIALFASYLYDKIGMRIPFHAIRYQLVKARVAKIGPHCSVLLNLEMRKPGNISIGDHTVINGRVLLDGRGGKIILGNNVDIGQETNIWTLEHDVHDDYHRSVGGDVTIEDYVWVASRVTILPGVKIGGAQL